MKIPAFIRDFFRIPRSLTGLRNKPGGLAWIDTGPHFASVGPLHGRFVTTVSLDVDGFWRIEPPQTFTSQCAFNCRGVLVFPGDRPQVRALADHMLVPVPDADLSKDEVAELYAPKVPERVPA